jgi:serine/threonine-protein kinase
MLTQEGMVFGTPEFMSPEQAQGKPLAPASDVYSIAVILYEVLTGKLPFDAKTAMDYIQLHVTAKPIPLGQRVAGRTFPPLLERIIDRALAKLAEDRFASAADFAAALQSVVDGAAQLPARLMPPPPAQAPSAGTPTNGTPPGAAALPAAPPASAMAAPAPRSSAALLVGVAVAFLALGVFLAFVLMKFVSNKG